MSRTLRVVIINDKRTVVDETKAKWVKGNRKGGRLAAYVKDKAFAGWKYKRYSVNFQNYNTYGGAQTAVNNANRSMKKGLRQRYKNEIKNELSFL